MSLRDLKLEAAIEALEFCQGNKTRAAKHLGVCVRTLRNWIAQNVELASWYRGHRKYPVMTRRTGGK